MIRLAVRVQRERAETVLAELLDLAPAGVEELAGEPGSAADGTIEYAVYGAPGELPALPDLRAAAGDALVEVRTTEIPDDWHERWRAFHRPVLIAAPHPAARTRPCPGAGVPSLLVRPPWEQLPDIAQDANARDTPLQEIVIDPGQAFGTGGHASTRLCLELLLELAACEDRRAALVDVGTGSGVLAIAAARLGFAPVLALDNDPLSVTAARTNAAANRVQIDVRRYDLRARQLPRPATVVLANLLRPLLLELASQITQVPAHVIAGGLLADEVEEIVHAFAARTPMHERERRRSGEWAAVWLSA